MNILLLGTTPARYLPRVSRPGALGPRVNLRVLSTAVDREETIHHILSRYFLDHQVKKLSKGEGLKAVGSLVEFVDQKQYMDPSFATNYGYKAPKSQTGLWTSIDVFNHTSNPQIYLTIGGAQAHKIGHGSFKVVSMGIDFNQVEPCAVLKLKNAPHPSELKQFSEEATLTKELAKGQGLGPMEYATYQSSRKKVERARFYMPFAVYGEMARYLRLNRDLSTSHLQQMMASLLSQLVNLHDKGYCHRDIKTENIFGFKNPDDPNEPKWALMDFGLASRDMHFKEMQGDLKFEDPSLFQLHADDPDTRGHSHEAQKLADAYAMGLSFFHAFAGKPHPNQDMVFHLLMSMKKREGRDFSEALAFRFEQTRKETLDLVKDDDLRYKLLDITHQLLQPRQQDRISAHEAFKQLVKP